MSGFEILFGLMALGLCAWVVITALGQYAKPRSTLRPGVGHREGLTPVERARAEARAAIERPETPMSAPAAAAETPAAELPLTESERLRREAEAAGIRSVLSDVKERKPLWKRLGGD